MHPVRPSAAGAHEIALRVYADILRDEVSPSGAKESASLTISRLALTGHLSLIDLDKCGLSQGWHPIDLSGVPSPTYRPGILVVYSTAEAMARRALTEMATDPRISHSGRVNAAAALIDFAELDNADDGAEDMHEIDLDSIPVRANLQTTKRLQLRKRPMKHQPNSASFRARPNPSKSAKVNRVQKPTAKIPPLGLRMQADLKAAIDQAARENNRSMNAEIVSRLEASFRAGLTE